MSSNTDNEKIFNRLSLEQSPYLLQHANNPVHWLPWGDEAFALAKKLDRPVFVSIGYSTCHWCHVMEHESFADKDVAELMNQTFINIKVDREERPDIDHMYMTACQMMTGHGGWPLTAILTPDGKPFFAGTYFPKFQRYGQPGMMELVPKIHEVWTHQREQVSNTAEHMMETLKKTIHHDTAPWKHDLEFLNRAFQELSHRFDSEEGGFGQAPKFPTPHHLLFLLRYYRSEKNQRALEMVEKTLKGMRLGGIYDHLGYGFHRYSTDREWLVPHFEKMLYDQALLMCAYTEAFQVTGDSFYEHAVREIAEYVKRELTSPKGGFYSAEDADSEGEEGRFYLWSLDEVEHVIGAQSMERAQRLLHLKTDGNYVEHGQKTGKNIPHNKTMEELSLTRLELKDELLKLFLEREKRVHPFKDDKILTDWNGLMIAAFAKAGHALKDESLIKTAKAAASFVLQTIRGPNGRLRHREREGAVDSSAFLDDSAFFIWGLTELHQATLEDTYLEEAVRLTEQALDIFSDPQGGAFFQIPKDGDTRLLRMKEIHDSAIPSGNSAMAYNLLRLSRLTGRTDWETKALDIFSAARNTLDQFPSAVTFLLCALDFATHESVECVITSRSGASGLPSGYFPNAVFLRPNPRLSPFTQSMSPTDEPVYYVCKGFRCELPVHSVEKALELFE